ncbi:MAG TPA: hypothetical protein VFP60_03150 [Pseudolabrys sp.]|nr:hypothetical protein [Pseudolabrys sp.]
MQTMSNPVHGNGTEEKMVRDERPLDNDKKVPSASEENIDPLDEKSLDLVIQECPL